MEQSAPENWNNFWDIAKTEWRELVPHLKKMGLLSSADKAALELYCSAYSRYVQAEMNVKKYGEIILSPNKKYAMTSPWATARNQAFQQLKSMLTEWGLTPCTRSRMRVKEDAEQKDDFKSFILRKTG